MNGLTLLAAFTAGASAAGAPAKDAGVYALVKKGNDVVKVSLFSDRDADLPVASVGDRAVTLRELSQALAEAHASHDAKSKPGKKDFTPVLDRLIGAQLVVQEAHEMGIDDLPEVRAEMEKFKDSAQRQILRERIVMNVAADPAEVKKRYAEAAREWKVRSLLFANEPDAKAFAAAVKAGGAFEALAARAVDAKQATGNDTPGWIGVNSPMLPQVRFAIADAKAGDLLPVVKVEKGFAVARVEDVREKDDPKLRAQVEAGVRKARQQEVMQEHYAALIKKYAHIDEKLFESLDFEAKEPGFAALAKDSRVVARIEGQEPIKVSDLCAAINESFFHGVEGAIREKRVNEKKILFLDDLLGKRVWGIEIAQQKIADSEEYKRRVREYEDELVFGTFVRRAVAPEVKVTEGDGQKYYEQHKSKYTYPAFYGIESLAFSSQQAAQAAMDKLRKGTDFKWLNANAEGQIPAAKRALDLDGNTVSASALPPQVVKALAGAQSGDVRLYNGDGQYFVLHVKQYTAPRAQPYADVRAEIAPKIADEKLNQALQAWIAKLRKAYDVKVYITRIVS